MNRITALNEIKSDLPDIIGESIDLILNRQYRLALEQKLDGQNDAAIETFNQLLLHEKLATLVMNDGQITKEHFIGNLKYNCFKHLAEIYEEKNDHEKAFEFLFNAINLDKTDVFEMHKWGCIASKLKQYHIAHELFANALKHNARHWPSMHETLKLLCIEENFFEAYGWALHIIDIYPNNQIAIDVLLDVREKFGRLEYLENSWNVKFNASSAKRSSNLTLFPKCKYVEPIIRQKPDLSKFMVKKPRFILFGRMLQAIYVELLNNKDFSLADFQLKEICPNILFISNNLFQPITQELYDDWILQKICKVCMQIVSQFSSNKKIFIDENTTKTTFMEMQRNYFGIIKTTNNSLTCQKQFDAHSERFLQQLMMETETGTIDIFRFMFKWLKHTSMCRQIDLPKEIQSLFLEIYKNQSCTIDLNSWSQMPYNDMKDMFCATLFYIELRITTNALKKKIDFQNLFDDQMMSLLHQLVFINGLYLQIENEEFLLRIKLLQFQYALCKNDFEMGMTLLLDLKEKSLEILKKIGEIELPPSYQTIQKSIGDKKRMKMPIPHVDLNHNITNKMNSLNHSINIGQLLQNKPKENPLDRRVSHKSRLIQKKKIRFTFDKKKIRLDI